MVSVTGMSNRLTVSNINKEKQCQFPISRLRPSGRKPDLCNFPEWDLWLGTKGMTYLKDVFVVIQRRFEPTCYLVGSRTGATPPGTAYPLSPRFLWECLTSRTVSWFPAPASSNPACRFPALGFPECLHHQGL